MKAMLFSIWGLFVIDILMAIQTFWTISHFISVGAIIVVSMHLIASVTLAAFKVLAFMNVSRDSLILAKIFFPNTTSMTRRTDFLHGRVLFKHMAL